MLKHTWQSQPRQLSTSAPRPNLAQRPIGSPDEPRPDDHGMEPGAFVGQDVHVGHEEEGAVDQLQGDLPESTAGGGRGSCHWVSWGVVRLSWSVRSDGADSAPYHVEW